MKQFITFINETLQAAFEACQYDAKYGKAILSNRPDLCQYQCNGALSAAKTYKKSPFSIASEVSTILKKSPYFKEVNCVMPGFINLTINDALIASYINEMACHPKYGCDEIGQNQTIIVDYGGPNVAKPLHVGHLRTAIIGESIKRLGNFLGYHMLGDVHLGDWGLQIGLIIAELHRRQPCLVYFDENYNGTYPENPPFTISELEEIYPAASTFAKKTPWFMKQAKEITYQFQNGHKGYVALWQHILKVSITDLKKNYENINVSFDLWKKESDAQPYIPQMIEDLKQKGFAYLDQGALIIDVKQSTDQKEIPPCILVKSDGATLYSTTDLATIVERMALYKPKEIMYIVDKRQSMHFEQVFRCAQKTGLVTPETKLTFLGFGTMNGKDGKPFKTRDGGVMRLEHLIQEVSDQVYNRMIENKTIEASKAKEISKQVGIAALKYGDLSNQIAKDYLFDLERFTSFEGNTGPYILYTVVRIYSILNKCQSKRVEVYDIQCPTDEVERDLMLKILQFNEVLTNSFLEYTPHRICQYIYELSNIFNRFYHQSKIITETDPIKQASWLKLISLTKDLLVCSLDLLGIEVPNQM
ncbi:MAG: arginine--tRNA ligase [Cellulosilyticum sp.]|nr:arginine--tRNA ligase [Cellulosilyticum sp.]